MTGQVIGHYRILEKIGSGSMGEVFRAQDERLGRDVALKLIRQSSGENPDHVRRFEFEARAAAALNHPNIIAVYDVGSYEGTPYIVCELLEGKTLRTVVTGGPLSVRLALDYALQIVQGLIAAHDRRIVHRDLKPENLFVTSDGRVKILDFGVAKLQSSAEDSGRSVEELTTVTRSGAVIGTVAYMSPEQLRSKRVDHRSDIFSVGAILYEMLTGSRAFRGQTEVDTITAVLREEPSEINLRESGVPLPFQRIVQHCLEKEPENRFQSARDLGFALETLSDGPGPRRKQRFAQPASKPKLLFAAVVGALLTAALVVIWNPWRKAAAPSYQRLTFEQGTVFSARFTPNYRAIVYGAAWNRSPLRLFSTVGDSLLSQPLNLTDANLLAISRSGELAVILHGEHGSHLETVGGVLARAPLAGGSPREILQDVAWADWDAKGELAVVHRVSGRDRIEYPLGHVLYQTTGWVSHIRLAPAGDRIAFLDHPIPWDDRGSVDVVDLEGHASVLSTGWESEDGLAWSPEAKEIWFTAVERGGNRELLAVSMSANVRKVLSLPFVGMTLQDVAPDGRTLVSLDTERLAMATMQRNGRPIDVSWRDWTIAKDISQDGQSILFEDASEAAGSQYLLAIRKMDGTPPVELGPGSAGGLSPDGKWAISILPGAPGQVTLVPTGAGQPRMIPTPGLEQIYSGAGHFLADGKHIMINAREHGHGVRCYLLDIEEGQAVPVTPEGITGAIVSPDGKYIVRADESGVVSVYPINEGSPHNIPDLKPGLIPVQWSEDNSSIYGYRQGEVPTKVYKINLATGQQSVIQELQPETATGAISILPVVVSRDASRFAYSSYQILSVLYVIFGLR
jgi:eukaryotic-like serine/threonine-protein kinase